MLVPYRHLFLQLGRIEGRRDSVFVLEGRLGHHYARGQGDLLLHGLAGVGKLGYFDDVLLPGCRPCGIADLAQLCLVALDSLADPAANCVSCRLLRCLLIVQILFTVYFG